MSDAPQEFASTGQVRQRKERRLLLTTDRLICASVVKDGGEERLTLKACFPLTEVEVRKLGAAVKFS